MGCICQAIFAVLSVTPTERLSEQVLSDGILAFWKNQNKIPNGIGMCAMEALAAKLALGLRKVSSKFKRLHGQAASSKTPSLTALKKRLSTLSRDSEQADPQPPVDAESVQVVAEALQSPSTPRASPVPSASPAPSAPKVDWVSLAAKMKKFKAAAGQPAQSHRPVPTPARTSHMLPEHVVETLKQSSCPVEPFSTANDAADDGAKPAGEDDDADQPKTADRNKNKKGKKTAAKTRAKKTEKKGEIAGAEAEQGLALVEPTRAVEPAAAGSDGGQPAVEADAAGYVPGEFNKRRYAFIKEHRAATGVSFREANAVWMSSSERATLLANVTVGQMKKRRFC